MVLYLTSICVLLLSVSYGHGAITVNLPECPVTIKEDVTAWKVIATPVTTGSAAGKHQFIFKSITPGTGNLLDNPAKIRMYPGNGSLYYGNNPGFNYERHKKYTVVITMLGETETKDATCVINIEDVNEPPTFTFTPASATIKENEAAGKVEIFTLTSSDPDTTSPNNDITYSVSDVQPASGSAKFAIVGNKVEADTTTPFDREKVSLYTITVKATDKGTPALSTTRVLSLEIANVNEAPYFPLSVGGAQPKGRVTLDEETQIGTKLSINHDFGSFIKAEDYDKNDPSTSLTYFLDGGQSGFFEARNVGGVCFIYVKSRIDSESNVIRKNFKMRVYARDTLNEISKDYTNVGFAYYEIDVTLKNINDNDPVCDPLTYAATIKENTPVRTTVLKVTCTDADGPLTRFDIKGNKKADQYFEIDPNGDLKVKDKADLESTGQVNFTADAVQGIPEKSVTITVSITITGENDNIPKFTSDFYNTETVCNYYPVPYALITVGQVSATDSDVTTSQMTYAWVGNDAVGTYTLLKTEGRIIPSRELNSDTECDKRWLYYVRASDNEPTPSTSKHIPIRIDSFKAKPYLVDFHVDSPTSYFTDARVTRFLDACSSGCNGCVCRLFRFFAKVNKETTSTTLTIYALSDASTNSFSNVNQPKTYVAKETMISTFDPTTKATSGLRIYDEFTITGVEATISDLLFHETVGGQIVISLLVLLVIAAIIGIAVKLARVHAAKKSGKGQIEEKKKLQPKKPTKSVNAERGYDGFNFNYKP